MVVKPEASTNSQKPRSHCITVGLFGMVTCEFQLLSITCNIGHTRRSWTPETIEFGDWPKPVVVVSSIAPHIETKFQSLGIGFTGSVRSVDTASWFPTKARLWKFVSKYDTN
jgi:hypothetical protein